MKLIRFIPVLLMVFFACQKPTDVVGPGNDPGNPSTNQSPQTGGTPTEVGQPVGTVTTQRIGSNGGTIALADGSLTLDFPAGAVSKETDITIQPIENKSHQGVGKAYRFGPDGTQFAKPIVLTWHYQGADLAGKSPEALAIAFQNKQGVWMANSTIKVDTIAHTVTAQLPHFSDWSFVFEYEIVTASEANGVTILAAAESVKIFVYTTHDLQNNPGSDGYWAMEKPYVMSSKDIVNWRINGQQNGGNYAQLGQLIVDPNYAQVIYTAPPRQPENNPLAVSTEIDVKEKGHLILIEYVSIESYASLNIAGTVDDNPNVQLTLFGSALYGTITNAQGQMSLTFVIKNFTGNGTYSVDKAHTVSLSALVAGAEVPYNDSYTDIHSGNWVNGGGKVTITDFKKEESTMKGSISGNLYFIKSENPITKPVSAVFRGKAISTQIPATPGG